MVDVKTERPWVLVNMAMTADGKIASENRRVVSFGSRRDMEHLMKLRSTVDAVMSGARTVDIGPVNLGPGSARYRKMRLANGLAEYNLRIVVSGSGTLNPQARIFDFEFSPVIVLTTERITKPRLNALQKSADCVRLCGERTIEWPDTLAWLTKEWGVNRLLCEGGGELNDDLFRCKIVDELHLTICPYLCGGRSAPTIAGGKGVEKLSEAIGLELANMKRIGGEMFLQFRRG